MSVIPATQGSINRKTVIQASLGIKPYHFSKITKAKRTGTITQVVQCLPIKHEDLSSNQSTLPSKVRVAEGKETCPYLGVF
jgi:hypothetical protein